MSVTPADIGYLYGVCPQGRAEEATVYLNAFFVVCLVGHVLFSPTVSPLLFNDALTGIPFVTLPRLVGQERGEFQYLSRQRRQ